MWIIENIWSIFDKTTEKDLKNQINQSKNNKTSKEFLHKLLKKLNEDNLTYKEKNFLENQIKEQEELLKLYEEYLKEKDFLWKQTQESLNNLFWEYEISIIWDENLNYIESQLGNQKEKFQFFRNYIKNCIDVNWELENIYETNILKFFIDQFTIQYINFMDKKWYISFQDKIYKNAYELLQKENIKNLLLNEKELKSILKNIILKFHKKWIVFNKTINFYIMYNKIFINLQSFKDNILLEIKKEEERKKQEKEKQEKIAVWIAFMKDNITKEQIQKVQNMLNIDETNISKLKKIYIKKILLWEKLINKDKLLYMMEKFEWEKFNYLNFLNDFWLSTKVEKLVLELVKKTIDIKITKENKEIILYNIKILIMFVLSMETDWYNVSNNQNSWAEWYFQFKFNNFWTWENKYSSFEIALRRYSKFFTDSYKIWEQNPKWIINAWKNSKNKNIIKDLTAEQQTILFLCDIFDRDFVKIKKINYNKGKKCKENKYKKIKYIDINVKTTLKNILLKWEKLSIEHIYNIHHTNLENYQKAKKRLESKLVEFFKEYISPYKG